jgi:Transglutaminase-like superfamily
MRRLKSFTQLTGAERRILVRALFVVGFSRASLWILPIKAARIVVAGAATGAAAESVQQVTWAVKAVGRCLPGASCLTHALAAQALLVHSGFPSRVEIGVAKSEDSDSDSDKDRFEPRRFQAHAWVVCHGQVVLGGQQIERYNCLVVWESSGVAQCIPRFPRASPPPQT